MRSTRIYKLNRFFLGFSTDATLIFWQLIISIIWFLTLNLPTITIQTLSTIFRTHENLMILPTKYENLSYLLVNSWKVQIFGKISINKLSNKLNWGINQTFERSYLRLEKHNSPLCKPVTLSDNAHNLHHFLILFC